jgi:HD-GYP domain-containing protein (c-di-GMP phosphodiesterase class II)
MAEAGMIIAEDVYTVDNRLIIPKNTAITDKIITRLKFYKINDISIAITEVQPMVTTHIKVNYSETIKSSNEFKKFNNKYDKLIYDLKSQLLNTISQKVPIDTSLLLNQIKSIVAESRNGIHLFDILHCMPESDDITYIHSLNVALISNVLGHWLKFSEEELSTLTLGGLLHDIGKLVLPPEIMYKRDSLTDAEYATVKTHPIRGSQLLNNSNLNPHILNMVLMHHERCDGSGYPSGLRSSRIDSFAKIIAIADVYDAMTSARVYRPALSPFEAISIFESEGLQKFDPHYIMTFLEEIVQAYVGNRVRLNNKQEGEIVMINKQILSRPIIQVEDQFIDLSKDHSLSIAALL